MNPSPSLVLASTSRYRRELLARLGVPFRAVAPACDEESLKRPGEAPRERAERLALAKAESLRELEPGAILLGSDQAATLDGAILDKPGTRARAAEQLRRLSGRTHELVTAVVLVHPGGVARHTDVTRLSMRALDDAAIDRYLDADEPFDCAGSYKFEARGVALFEQVATKDPTAIVGLPLIAVTTLLRDLGLAIP
jgi:septum formation protein